MFAATRIAPSAFAKRSVSPRDFNAYPKNVGILAMDAYFPSTFVKQEDLETYDSVAKGKYTVGLEQDNMAFCGDREDIYSMCLTATQNLLEKYNIPKDSIGRLEVGTETVLDKSKSVKTVLMSLFDKNHNIEGIDTINACYGGTSALLNAVNWIESSSWDGRYALVVTGDIAVYAPGNARPTGGAGVVAMLIGPEAPLALERGLKTSYFEHAWDFYKPNLESEYPMVDGKSSIVCYLRALDYCYRNFRDMYEKQTLEPFTRSKIDYALFHSPFAKMSRKCYGRLAYNDFLKHPETFRLTEDQVRNFSTLGDEESYSSKEVEKTFYEVTKDEYKTKVEPVQLLPKQLGNSYTGSLYTSLLSLIANKQDQDLLNKRLFMFSYGSGLASTAFSLKVASSPAEIRQKSDILNRLALRTAVSPEQFSAAMLLREDTHSKLNYRPVGEVKDLFKGTYYLDRIDEMKRRHYQRRL
eukprot:TRINITY_DN2719_c0_g1_i1.p1 TRINITY_DN2719_c0_g1~~TRINITY_DN2719_c0_g1_i1.p1  ORF type:complete len:468 (-),score=120.74 TRINITY_DN2719_c0_g1_i1:28-1431(-)